jgi:hypothetical protein
MTDKNVEGAESGTKVSEYDMTKMIEILSQQGKYKILTLEEYELLSHRKPSVKKEDSVFGQFPTGYNTSTPSEVGNEVPPRPPLPTPLRKSFHDYSVIHDVKPKVSFNLGRETPDMAGNVSPSCPSAESILMSQSLDDLVDGNDLGLNEFCDVSWSDEQKRDIDIARVIELKRVEQKLTKRQISKESQYVRKLLYDWNSLIMRNGILYRVSNMNSETTYQLVLPVD